MRRYVIKKVHDCMVYARISRPECCEIWAAIFVTFLMLEAIFVAFLTLEAIIRPKTQQMLWR